MQVTVLFQMMRYFSRCIVNMKKAMVKFYIHACIFVYLIYFIISAIGLIVEVGSGLSRIVFKPVVD